MTSHRPAAALVGIALSILLPPVASGAGLEFGHRGIQWESEDENVRLRVGGRLHADAYVYDDDVTSLDNEVELRRLRLYLSGALFRDLRFKIEGDVSPDRDGWRNVYGTWRGWDNVEIRGGNFTAPVGFEDQISSNDTTFMERSLAAAITPGFLAGGQVSTWGRRWSVRVGGFGNPLGGSDIERRSSEGASFAARVTGAPWRQERQLLHLGASVEYRDIDSGRERRR